MISIVTDSSASLSSAEAREWGVRLISIHYNIGNQSFLESASDLNGNFEKLMQSAPAVSTGHPPAEAFRRCFQTELAQGHEVLCLTISARLSGTFSSAQLAAREIGSPNVEVVDSQLTAGGLYLLVRCAVRLASQRRPLSEAVRLLEIERAAIVTAFSVDDLTPLRQSGRLGTLRQGVETILNIRPILLCREGTIVYDSLAHGDRDIIRQLLNIVDPRTTEVVINYLGNSQQAVNLYQVLQEKFSDVTITLRKLGPVLAIHLGLKVIALSSYSPLAAY